jgi:hypothetical protein
MAKVTPYLRTEWGIRWYNGDVTSFAGSSALYVRELVDDWNNDPFTKEYPSKVVQRSISDWGDDE